MFCFALMLSPILKLTMSAAVAPASATLPPSSSVGTAETSVSQSAVPEIPTNPSEEAATQPEAAATQPEAAAATQPEAAATQPEPATTTTQSEPAATTSQSEPAATQPEPATTTTQSEPATTTTQSEPAATTTTQPEAATTTTQPEAAATTTQPEAATTTQPEAAAPPDAGKKPVICDGPKLSIGNSETTPEKQIKSIDNLPVPDKQQWIEFVLDMKNQEFETMYSPKLLAFTDKVYENLKLLKYKTNRMTDDGKKLKDTPIDDGFKFTSANLVIQKSQKEDKSFKYVISIRSEKGKENNLYERLIDNKNKDAYYELRLNLKQGTDKTKDVELKTDPFRINTSTTPHSLEVVVAGELQSTPWYKDWKWLLGIGLLTLLIIGLIAYFMVMKRSDDSENYE